MTIMDPRHPRHRGCLSNHAACGQAVCPVSSGFASLIGPPPLEPGILPFADDESPLLGPGAERIFRTVPVAAPCRLMRLRVFDLGRASDTDARVRAARRMVVRSIVVNGEHLIPTGFPEVRGSTPILYFASTRPPYPMRRRTIAVGQHASVMVHNPTDVMVAFLAAFDTLEG